MTIEQLRTLHQQHTRVVVVGDIMLDRYVVGQVDRVSPEAPVPICRVTSDRAVPGGAANVGRNLSDFGCSVELIGILGENDPGSQELRTICTQLGIGTGACVSDPGRPTTVKTRIIGNGQQITRIDREDTSPLSKAADDELVMRCLELCKEADLVIVSDYAKGTLTKGVIDALRTVAESGVLVAVDPHPSNQASWHGFSVIKPNFLELKQITGTEILDYEGGDPVDSKGFQSAISKINADWQPDHLLVTLSSNGMYYADRYGTRQWLPTRAAEIFDVSGAGDTSITFFALALAAGWSGVDAMELAIASSGIVVRKAGTASVTLEELETQCLIETPLFP